MKRIRGYQVTVMEDGKVLHQSTSRHLRDALAVVRYMTEGWSCMRRTASVTPVRAKR